MLTILFLSFLSAIDVDALLRQMTIEEKIGQLNLLAGDVWNQTAQVSAGLVGGVLQTRTVSAIRTMQELALRSRLRIPLIFGEDVIHGYKTIFPVPLALSASWNTSVAETCARISAVESTADGLSWTYSPMVDIARDSRWGRIVEGSGEDQYLGGEFAAAMVRGYQGSNLADPRTMMACVKHYAAYGASEAGRDYNWIDMSLHRLFNEFLYPYKAACDAGSGSIMVKYNELAGIPSSGDKMLLTDILRTRWGYTGFVVSDWETVPTMPTEGWDGIEASVADAINAGLDMDMVAQSFSKYLLGQIASGNVPMTSLDRACRNILVAKDRLGLFDDPYRYCNESRANEIFTPANRKASRDCAVETFVLLKNDQNILPLKKSATILLTGPLANASNNMNGCWCPTQPDSSSSVGLLAGMAAVVEANGGTIKYAKGSNVELNETLEKHYMSSDAIPRDTRSEQEMIDEAVALAKDVDVIVFAGGETAQMSGETTSRAKCDVPATQRKLVSALLATGKPLVFVLFSGRALELSWAAETVPAILNVWFPGTEGGNAISDVLFGDASPSGRLTISYPTSTGQFPYYYNIKKINRPGYRDEWYTKYISFYLDVINEPVFPFGYGLTYSTVSYSAPALSRPTFAKGTGQTITLSVNVTNTGTVPVKEVVQFYIQDIIARPSRPIMELKGWKKVPLAPGATQTVSFEISEETLKYYDFDLNYVAQEGEFLAMVGPNSRDVQTLSFHLV